MPLPNVTITIWNAISLSLPTFALLPIDVYCFLHWDKLGAGCATKC